LKVARSIIKEFEDNDFSDKELISKWKEMISSLNKIFEWHDGILVQAMKDGGVFLIDEISLASDSVLERLNSVFEKERSLTLAEKASKNVVKIIGHQNFNVVATMNPSGDYGKKELSPALRNRFTEIWVQTYFEEPNLIAFTNGFNEIPTEISEKIW
jgi:midasin